MRRLTFSGFTKRYVAQLSLRGTTGIYPLAREAVATNPRLREPLFLYAVSCGKEKVLLQATRGTALHDEYSELLSRYDDSALLAALEADADALPEGYRKVWHSYLSVANRYDRDVRVKELLRQKALRTQSECGVSTYRLAKDLGLNNANVWAWLKTGEAGKVSMEAARSIAEYLEHRLAAVGAGGMAEF